MPTIHDIIYIPEEKDSKLKPIGEANSLKSSQDTLQRLFKTISNLMDEAQKSYNTNAYHPDTKQINLNYITRLSTSEFFFYTLEPLSLAKFEQLQNDIAAKAKTMSTGVHLILGSFAVITDEGRVLNVTPHIRCGEFAEFCFVVKNFTSAIDFRYDTENSDGESEYIPVHDCLEKCPLPTIHIGKSQKEFSFNNIILSRTPGGVPFISAVEICLDHLYEVAKKNYQQFLQTNPSLSSLPVSHVIVSYTVDLIEKHCISNLVMHVDPEYSLENADKTSAQKTFLNTQPFGDSEIIKIEMLPVSMKKNRTIENVYGTMLPSDKGRRHYFFNVDINSVKFNGNLNTRISLVDFKKKYQNLNGDLLKLWILEDLKLLILDTTSSTQFEDLKNDINSSFEMEVLKTGQGWFTRLFGLKTSSQIALENMLDQQKLFLNGNSNI
jgi:hypothetical protein